MKVIIERYEGWNTERKEEEYSYEIAELSENLLDCLNEEGRKMSGDYSNYVLSIGWDTEKNMPCLYFDGPWEC